MSKQPYHDLVVWQEGHKFVLDTYRLSQNFPQEERYGLTSQLRRAAISITANIVEGYAKESDKEFLRFLNIAEASSKECAYHLELTRDLGYLDKISYDHLENQRTKTDFLLRKYKISILKRFNSA